MFCELRSQLYWMCAHLAHMTMKLVQCLSLLQMSAVNCYWLHNRNGQHRLVDYIPVRLLHDPTAPSSSRHVTRRASASRHPTAQQAGHSLLSWKFGQGSCWLQGSWSSEDGEGAFTKAVLARETRMAVQGQLDPLSLLQALQVRAVCTLLCWQITTMGVLVMGTKHASPRVGVVHEVVSAEESPCQSRLGRTVRLLPILGLLGTEAT